MTTWVAVVLAGSAAAVWCTPTGPGALRLTALAPSLATGDVLPPLLSPLLAGVVVWTMAGLPAALLIAGGAIALRRVMRARQRITLEDHERTRALDALSLLGADLRAGRTPSDALAAAADVASGTSRAALLGAAAAARLGGDVVSALRADDSAVSSTLHALGACWQVCSDAGSGLAAAVERLEEGLRAAEAQRRSVAAELAGPRATAQLLAVLPLGGIGLAGALGADPLHLLLRTPLGLCCLLTGLTLDTLGVVWTRRLVDGALR